MQDGCSPNRKFTLYSLSLCLNRQRAKELEEELDRTSQAYKNQVTHLKFLTYRVTDTVHDLYIYIYTHIR